MNIAKNRFALDLETVKSARFLSLLLFAVTLAVFLPAVQDGFNFYDDQAYILGNSNVRTGLTWTNFLWAFNTYCAANWHPLTWLSHMLDAEIYGLNPWGHHLTNVLFHATNTVLVFWVFRKITGGVWQGFVIALLFGIHPLRVEPVAWICERKDLLSTMFWLLAMATYLQFVEAAAGVRRKRFYGLTLLFFALGLLSKQMIVTLPFVFLLLDFWPLNRWSGNVLPLLREKVPFLLLTVVASAVAYAAKQRFGALEEMSHLTFSARFENAAVSYVRYLGKFFWPENLCVYYPHPGHWPLSLVLFAFAFVIGISVVALVFRKQIPYLFVGWFWYIGTLVPVIGLVQLYSLSMADVYTYIPLIGIYLIIVRSVAGLAGRWRIGLAVVTTATAVACIALTLHQLTFWRNDIALWNRAIAVTKNNYVAHSCLGVVLWPTSRHNEAIHEFQTSLNIEPAYVTARKWVATDMLSRGDFDDAIVQLQEVLRLQPASAASEHDLGLAYANKRQWDMAIIHFKKAMQLGRDSAADMHDLGYLLSQNGQWSDALPYYQRSIQLDPTNASSQNDLGVALINNGRFNEGVQAFQESLRLNPNYAAARDNLEKAMKLEQKNIRSDR